MSSLTFFLLAALLSCSLGAPFTISAREGLTLDACESDDDCLGKRRCRLDVCTPNSIPSCETSQDCGSGEICVFHIFNEQDGLICVSEGAAASLGLDEGPGGPIVEPQVSPSPEDGDLEPIPSSEFSDAGENESPSPSPEEVCIDASALEHLDEKELVFKTHPTARVLCDASGSCATKGHMVTWNGKAMMMRTYCTIVGCEQRTMKVNSPRYTRGLRVTSKTDGLHFTAFAARYESRAEEGVLNAAVRMGL